jgi:hypothetical protein
MKLFQTFAIAALSFAIATPAHAKAVTYKSIKDGTMQIAPIVLQALDLPTLASDLPSSGLGDTITPDQIRSMQSMSDRICKRLREKGMVLTPSETFFAIERTVGANVKDVPREYEGDTIQFKRYVQAAAVTVTEAYLLSMATCGDRFVSP